MSIKNDRWIAYNANNHNMIQPFEKEQVRTDASGNKIISYGLSSYGYDIRIANEFKIFTNVNSAIVDPKNFNEAAFVSVNTDVCIIPPNSFILGRSVERLNIPDDVLCVCLGKSSMARCGLIVNVTPFEPGWEGYVTIEVSNSTPLPAKVYANEGIAQVLFFQGDPCEINYRARSGKYQNQPAAVVLPRL